MPVEGSKKNYGIDSFSGLKLGIMTDLGFARNAPALSEVWLDTGFAFGTGETLSYTGYDDKLAMLISYDIALSHRTYLGSSGLYLAPRLGLGVDYMMASHNHDSEQDLKALSYGVQAGVQLGLNIGTSHELQAQIAYNYGIDGGVKIGEDKIEDLYKENKRSYTPIMTDAKGVSFYVGYVYHLPSAGPIAFLYAK